MSLPSFAEHFPALRGGFSYLDNAAGAQVPTDTIDAISRFLSSGSCNVGLPRRGRGGPLRAGARVQRHALADAGGAGRGREDVARALGLMPDGAVRASLPHYNTAGDVDRLLAGLDSLP